MAWEDLAAVPLEVVTGLQEDHVVVEIPQQNPSGGLPGTMPQLTIVRSDA